MKKSKKRKVNYSKIVLFIAPFVLITLILTMQTKLSMLNQEFNNNKEELSMLRNSNDDLEMQINESLTRDNVSQFAVSQGLVQSVANVIDLSGVSTTDE